MEPCGRRSWGGSQLKLIMEEFRGRWVPGDRYWGLAEAEAGKSVLKDLKKGSGVQTSTLSWDPAILPPVF
jgi:hypothetical protein